MDEMEAFLNPGLRLLAPLEEWPGLDQAARILTESIVTGKKLAIWGDYDVDGVTAVVLFKEFMAMHGLALPHHLPDRLGHGYGLNTEGVETLASQGIELILTVDCGITDHHPIRRAMELGLRVLVADHHLPEGQPAAADAVFAPRLHKCPCPDLTGVGLSFLLAAAVNRLLPGPSKDLRPLLDLVALGSLADVAKVTDQNRILIKNGLLLIAEANRPGIAALKEVCGFARRTALNAEQVSFSLNPRLNAAGRMAKAEEALALLLSQDIVQAKPIAARLNCLNQERKRVEQEILEQALAQAEKSSAIGLVLHGQAWHPGVLGIVAARVAERYYRPTLILSSLSEGEYISGSGRSIKEVDIFQALNACAGLLTRFGGHRQAAGLTLSRDNLDLLKEQFNQAVLMQINSIQPIPVLEADMELGFERIGFDFLKELAMLEPYGPGNPEPLFVSPPLTVRGSKVFGKNHLALDLRDERAGVSMKGKFWGQAERCGNLNSHTVRVVYTPRLDLYNGLTSIDLSIKDIEEC